MCIQRHFVVWPVWLNDHEQHTVPHHYITTTDIHPLPCLVQVTKTKFKTTTYCYYDHCVSIFSCLAISKVLSLTRYINNKSKQIKHDDCNRKKNCHELHASTTNLLIRRSDGLCGAQKRTVTSEMPPGSI